MVYLISPLHSIFAGDLETTRPQLEAFSASLNSDRSFFNRYRPASGVHASIVDGQGAGKSHIESHKHAHIFNPLDHHPALFFSLSLLTWGKL
jgi:hypothetical protein